MSIDLLVFAVIGGIVLAVITVVFYQRRKQNKILTRMGQTLGAVKSGRVMSAVFEGTEYRYEHYPGSKNAPSFFRIFVDCPSSGEFKIVREKGFDRFGKSIGLASEIQTGDPEFDDQFYIMTDTVEFTSAYLLEGQKRQDIRNITRLGFNEILHDGKILEARWTPFKLKEGLDSSFVTAGLPLLQSLSRLQTVHFYPKTFGETVNWKARKIMAVAVPAVLLGGGIACWIWSDQQFPPLDGFALLVDSLKTSLPSFGLFLCWAVWMLRGRSTAHRDLLVVLILALFAFPVAGGGLAAALNGWLDTSPAVAHETVVVEKYTTRSKQTTYYHVRVKSWRPHGQTEKLSVRAEIYRAITPHQTKMITVTKPGHLGFEWLVSQGVARTGG
jgi:hypothetical protein